MQGKSDIIRLKFKNFLSNIDIPYLGYFMVYFILIKPIFTQLMCINAILIFHFNYNVENKRKC